METQDDKHIPDDEVVEIEKKPEVKPPDESL